jgi:5'-3' exonuclease
MGEPGFPQKIDSQNGYNAMSITTALHAKPTAETCDLTIPLLNMGVKMLNRLMMSHGEKGICPIHLSMLAGKSVAVDVSIYMYRFLKTKELVSGFYRMCLLFKTYNITPVFVFDGKPPSEKSRVLDERRTAKKKATDELREVKKQIAECEAILRRHAGDISGALVDLSGNVIEDAAPEDVEDAATGAATADMNREGVERRVENLNAQAKKLSSKSVYLKSYHISDVMKLVSRQGFAYVKAPGEADVVCAAMCRSGEVYAVLSDDTDLFVYGCPRVLRYFSMSHHSCKLYTTQRILDEMNMDQRKFTLLAVLSGTDYEHDYNDDFGTMFNIFMIYHFLNTPAVWKLLSPLIRGEPLPKLCMKRGTKAKMPENFLSRYLYFIHFVTKHIESIRGALAQFERDAAVVNADSCSEAAKGDGSVTDVYTVVTDEPDEDGLRRLLEYNYIFIV